MNNLSLERAINELTDEIVKLREMIFDLGTEEEQSGMMEHPLQVITTAIRIVKEFRQDFAEKEAWKKFYDEEEDWIELEKAIELKKIIGWWLDDVGLKDKVSEEEKTKLVIGIGGRFEREKREK